MSHSKLSLRVAMNYLNAGLRNPSKTGMDALLIAIAEAEGNLHSGLKQSYPPEDASDTESREFYAFRRDISAIHEQLEEHRVNLDSWLISFREKHYSDPNG